jgi:hypothetical protein
MKISSFRARHAVSAAIVGLSLLIMSAHPTDSFLVDKRMPSARCKGASTSLRYTNHNYTAIADSTTTFSKLEIPILGPLLHVPKPLIVGESLTLDHLTPLQWKTIETCVEAQHSQNGGNMATIDPAPLVAILCHNSRPDLATIAAVVGISSGNHPAHDLDTSCSESLQESLLRLSSSSSSRRLYNDDSNVRLMGIGRAKLTHQFVKKAASGGDDGNGDGEEEEEPILMAQMQLLLDSHEAKHASSPVHAVNKLSILTSRIRFLHQDRQRIVRGLQAAQLKLEMAMEEWEDHDGIGAIFDRPHGRPQVDERVQSTLHSFLREFDGDAMERYDHNCASSDTTDPSVAAIATTSLPLSPRASRCLAMDNFGLGSSSTAVSDLTRMATVLAERLAPYYSPQRIATEEFHYEAFSWVALGSIQHYLSSTDIERALESRTTTERLEWLYRSMLDHKQDLTELAQAKSQELRDCGEECTGFF